jgi:hypothetical protein
MIPLTSLIFQKQLCSNEFEKTGLKLLRVVYSKMNLKKILFFNIINAIVIETAIYNQWDIFLVTNPDLYYNQITKTTIPHQSGRISTYSKELWLINAINNKYWYYNGLYWKVTI